VSGLTEVTAVGADHFMIFDATDSALKKSLVSDVLESATSISTSADATAITIDSNEKVTFTSDVTTGGHLSVGGNNNELRFYEGSNYVGFEAPALSADKIWVLPAADGSNGQVISTDGSGNLSFADAAGGVDGISSSADATAITIDSSERIGIPAIGQVNVLGTQIPYLSINGINAQNAHVNIHRHRANGLGGYLSLSKSRSDTKDFTIVQANDELGTISFQGADGSQFQQAAQIQAEVDGTPGSSDMPGRIVFLTTPDGSGTPTEKLRILSGGGITFNGDTAAANALDDYEEGTWTPALSGVTTTSSTMYGIYTKIGNICHIHAKIEATVASLPGATFVITGIPFTAENASDANQRAIIHIGGDAANIGSNAFKAHFRTNSTNLSAMFLNSSTTYMTYNTMDHTTFELNIHGFYRTT